MSEYHTIEFLKGSMGFVSVHSLLKKAILQKEKREWRDIWLVNYSKMTRDTYESFDAFYGRVTVKVCEKPSHEIVDEVEAIREKVKKQNGNI